MCSKIIIFKKFEPIIKYFLYNLLDKIIVNWKIYNMENITILSENQNDFEFKIALLVGITFTFTFIVGLIGNTLVLLTVLLQKKMHNATNILILNLAIAELLFIIICVPFTGLNYVLR